MFCRSAPLISEQTSALVFTVGEGAVEAGAGGTGLAMVIGLAGALALVAGALGSFDLQAVMMKKKMKAIR